jgi:N-carbamoylputrescine amidase
MKPLQLAVVQMAMVDDEVANVGAALEWVHQAARQGAGLVLLPELFAGPYFCQSQREEFFSRAHPIEGHPFLERFAKLARERRIWLPVSFFERAGQAHYNSLLWFNPEGRRAGLYRKSHIPDGPGYQEKYYFRPGDTGLVTVDTEHGRVGAGICWDQWYPELARGLVLQGAGMLLYPTAIGSEPPQADSLDTRAMWRRAMVGHAVCNACYVAAANRVGVEGEATFYGSSFICDPRGEMLAQAGPSESVLLQAEIDLDAASIFRAGMGFFRDRRPDLYAPLLTADGTTRL